MECLAIDWSGAVHGASSRIWIARARGGVLTALEMPGSRAAVGDALAARRHDPAPCLVGLDFAFGFPAWFAAASAWHSIEDVWLAARNEGEQWLADCESPFWGRSGKRRTHDVARGLRHTERTFATTQLPKSSLQVGGAGSVGTGSIRGMPMLRSLRRAGWAVWPFDPPGTHTLVEIYPRLFTGPVVKRSPVGRAEYLRRDHAAQAPAVLSAMERSEDAFDAGLSAIAMSRAVCGAHIWPACAPSAAIEGQIWVPADKHADLSAAFDDANGDRC